MSSPFSQGYIYPLLLNLSLRDPTRWQFSFSNCNHFRPQFIEQHSFGVLISFISTLLSSPALIFYDHKLPSVFISVRLTWKKKGLDWLLPILWMHWAKANLSSSPASLLSLKSHWPPQLTSDLCSTVTRATLLNITAPLILLIFYPLFLLDFLYVTYHSLNMIKCSKTHYNKTVVHWCVVPCV